MSSSISLHPSSLSPHRSAVFISWALPVSPRTTIPILLSLHVIKGLATRRDCFDSSTQEVLHNTERNWLVQLNSGVDLRSSLWWTKGGVTEDKTVFQKLITPSPTGRIWGAVCGEEGVISHRQKPRMGLHQDNTIPNQPPFFLPCHLNKSKYQHFIFRNMDQKETTKPTYRWLANQPHY